MIIKAYLSDSRIQVSEAENGEEAFHVVQSESFDIILLDMQMPIMDGYTCASKIRQWEHSQNIKAVPILALTAYSRKEDRKKCIDAGCSNHLSKPVRKNKLFYMISNL